MYLKYSSMGVYRILYLHKTPTRTFELERLLFVRYVWLFKLIQIIALNATQSSSWSAKKVKTVIFDSEIEHKFHLSSRSDHDECVTVETQHILECEVDTKLADLRI